MTAKRKYWLMKTEPDVFSIDDLLRKGTEPWDGVRNYRARNFMRDMACGDLVLFYHSNAKPPGVAGLATISRLAYPDPTQFNPESKYFDPKSSREQPRWDLVEVAFLEKFPVFVPLEVLKTDPELADMWVTRRGMRLSVQPVERAHVRRVLKLGKAKTRA